MIEDKIYGILKEIHNTRKEIKEMQELNADRLKELDRSLGRFSLKTSRCNNCRGTGSVSYTYGYQDECTGEMDCDICLGTGYTIEEILPVIDI